MTHSLSLDRPDLHVIIAGVVQLHADGLDRAAREDAQVRDLLVGARDWQSETAYPSRGEIAITLNALLRTAKRVEGLAVRLDLSAQRLNIVLAALARFARMCREAGVGTEEETAAILAGQALDLKPCVPASPERIQRLAGRIRLQLVGQAIAA